MSPTLLLGLLPSEPPAGELPEYLREELDTTNKLLASAQEMLHDARDEATQLKARLAEVEAELQWMAVQWDDSLTTGDLAGRCYDMACTAQKLLLPLPPGKDEPK